MSRSRRRRRRGDERRGVEESMQELRSIRGGGVEGSGDGSCSDPVKIFREKLVCLASTV